MNLYHVQYDGETYYVEAVCLGNAAKLWKQHVKELWGVDYEGTEEPESIALVHDSRVIRAENFAEIRDVTAEKGS